MTNPSLIFTDTQDTTLIELPVQIDKRHFLLREANGDIACKYRNALIKRVTFGPQGNAQSIDGLADIEPLLISWCLIEVAVDEVGQPTAERIGPPSLSDIRSWKPRILKHLYEEAKRISELDEDERTLPQLLKEKEAIEEKIAELEKNLAKND